MKNVNKEDACISHVFFGRHNWKMYQENLSTRKDIAIKPYELNYKGIGYGFHFFTNKKDILKIIHKYPNFSILTCKVQTKDIVSFGTCNSFHIIPRKKLCYD